MIYGKESFLTSLENIEKQKTYTFGDLKKEACNYFSIPVAYFKYFSIVNDRFQVFSSSYLVWDFHKVACEKNQKTLEYEHIELIDRMSIFFNRQTNLNDFHADKNINFNINPNEDKRLYLNTLESNFKTDLEDYFLFLLKVEGLKKIFDKGDKIQEKKLKERFEERVSKWKQKWNIEAAKLQLDTEEKVGKEEEYEILERKNYEEKLKKLRKKKDPKIYMNVFELYKFRLINFLNFSFSILIIGLMFIYYSHKDTINLESAFNIDKVLKDYFLFNPLYKDFYFSSKFATNYDSFGITMKDKNNILIFMEILLGNILALSKTEFNSLSSSINNENNIGTTSSSNNNFFFKTNNIFSKSYNDVFFKKDSIYSIFKSVAFDFKTTSASKLGLDFIDVMDDNNTAIGFKEFSTFDEKTFPKLMNYSNFRNRNGNTEKIDFSGILNNDIFICDNCFSRKLVFYELINFLNSTNHGELSSYEFGGFTFYFNPLYLTRNDYYNLMNIARKTFMDQELRFFSILFDINVNGYNCYYRVKISFEFTTIGNTISNIKTDIIPLEFNQSGYYEIIEILWFFLNFILIVKSIFNILSQRVIAKQSQSSNYLYYYDLGIVVLFVFLEIYFANIKSL